MDEQRVEKLVEQAVHVLMARNGSSTDEATGALTAEAASRGLPLATVAAEIIAGLDRVVEADDTAGHVVPHPRSDDPTH